MKRVICCLSALFIPSIVQANFEGVYDTYSGSYVNTKSTTASDYFEKVESYKPTISTTVDYYSKKTEKKVLNQDGGFFISPNYKMEWSDFQFDMNSAGSIVSWDDMTWSTFGADFGYKSKTSTFGFSAGYHHGTSSSGTGTDDDLHNGGGLTEVCTDSSCSNTTAIGFLSISVGDVSGTKDDAYAKFSLNDFWKNDSLTFSPNVGYRYFQHRLKIKDSYVMQIYAQEISINSDGNPYLDSSGSTEINGIVYGTTHDYKTTWSGPFIGFDIKNQFTSGGFFSLGAEFGLPTYKGEGDWPNRTDLADPGFEDSGKFGDSYHVGLSMNYLGKISENLFLDLGMEFNYYHLSNGEAKTNFYDGTSVTIEEELNATWKSISGNIGLRYNF